MGRGIDLCSFSELELGFLNMDPVCQQTVASVKSDEEV